ncbi:uncharacterized protein LOC144863879 [Branchiostoma floridae x Branchiostoma japonicum]
MDLMTRELFFFFLASVCVQASPLGKTGADHDGFNLAAKGVEVFYRPENPESVVPEKRWGGACLGCPPDPILISGRASPDSESTLPENPHHESQDSGVPEKRWGGACLGCPPDPILISGRASPDSGTNLPENPHHENPDSVPQEVPESLQPVVPDSGRSEVPQKRWGGECLGCPPDPIILLGKRKRSA